MKIPFWKNILSYLTDLRLDQYSSSYNELIQVYLSRGQYQLRTKNAIYSFGLRYDNFTGLFESLDWKKYQPKTSLLLGLGLGSIPLMLEKKFSPGLKYTAIEVDETITRLAEKYVLSKNNFNLDIITGDALIWLKTTQERFDMICMDIFQDDVIPEVFMTMDYLHLLKETIADDGLIIYNCLAQNKSDKRLANEFYQNKFQKVFPSARKLLIKGNYLLLNKPNYLKSDQ